MLKKKKERTRCFLDFEFNTIEMSKSKGRELISMGAVFLKENGEIAEEYYQVVKPSKRTQITGRCVRYTGISREEFAGSPSFDVVAQRFLALIDKWNADEFYVWGNSDQSVVEVTVKVSHADERMNDIAKKFIDYQMIVKQKFKSANVFNLERMADVCGISFKHSFSALADAKCLAQIYWAVETKTYDKKKYKDYEQYYGIKRFIGTYKGRITSLSKKREHLVDKQEKIGAMKKGSEEYQVMKENIAENKKQIRHLEKFFRDNEDKYEKSFDILAELEKNLNI